MNLRNFNNGEKSKAQDDAKETYERFKNASYDELYVELMKRVYEGKNDGSFDKNRLLSMLSIMSSSLSSEQLKKMEDIINGL